MMKDECFHECHTPDRPESFVASLLSRVHPHTHRPNSKCFVFCVIKLTRLPVESKLKGIFCQPFGSKHEKDAVSAWSATTNEMLSIWSLAHDFSEDHSSHTLWRKAPTARLPPRICLSRKGIMISNLPSIFPSSYFSRPSYCFWKYYLAEEKWVRYSESQAASVICVMGFPEDAFL